PGRSAPKPAPLRSPKCCCRCSRAGSKRSPRRAPGPIPFHRPPGDRPTPGTVLIHDDEQGMRAALREAEQSAAHDEVPIGCVIVQDGIVIGRGHNQTEGLKDATAHAEILAIGAASNTLDSWR